MREPPVVVVDAVVAGGDVALLHPVLEHLSGLDEDGVLEGGLLVDGALEDVRAAQAHGQEHEVLGARPLALVAHREGDDLVGNELVADSHQLGVGGRTLRPSRSKMALL
jgi:hypothetical protein